MPLAALDDAIAALRAGSGAQALDALLIAWRQMRAPEIAAQIEALSVRLSREPLPKTKTQKAHLTAWIDRARQRDPADIALLLAEIDAIWQRARPSQMVPALEELIEREPDPRLGHRAVRWIEDQIGRGSFNDKLWRRLTHLVVATGDPATSKPLEQVQGKSRGNRWLHGWIGSRLPRAVARLDESIPQHEPLGIEDRRRCDEIAFLLDTVELDPARDVRKVDDATHTELLEAVWNDPHDDGLRLVLADALTEAGDPRGELISLQVGRLGREPTRRGMARERALIREHGASWIGGLARLTYKRSWRFARGFLVACELKPLKALRIAAEAHHPEWATVERIVFSKPGPRWTSMVTPAMRSCRALVGVCEHGLRMLVEDCAHLPVEELEVATEASLHEVIERLGSTDGLTRLRTLSIAWDRNLSALDALWPSAVGRRLETLVVRQPPDRRWQGPDLPVKRVVLENRYGFQVTNFDAPRRERFVEHDDDVPWVVPVAGVSG